MAHTGPNQNHITDKVLVDGRDTYVVAPDGTPLGPGLRGRYLLGADQNGRDVMVRLMYGRRTSIYIGVLAAVITTLFAVIIGTLAGYYRGWIDAVLSRILDVVWAFPVLLLGIALGTTLALGGFKIGGLVVAGDSLMDTDPHHRTGLRAVHGPPGARRILALREKEFVGPPWPRVRTGADHGLELLPNIVSTIIVFFTLNIANNMLLESALSFPGCGRAPANASWGTMIADGYQTIYTAPHLTIVPGLMIVLTVLSLNVFGDGLRDALDPGQDQAGDTSMLRFAARRLIGMIAVLFAISGDRVPDLQRHSQFRPGGAHRGQERQSCAHRPGERGPGAGPSAAGAVPDHDEADLHRRAHLVCEQPEMAEQIWDGLPATLSLCIARRRSGWRWRSGSAISVRCGPARFTDRR